MMHGEEAGELGKEQVMVPVLNTAKYATGNCVVSPPGRITRMPLSWWIMCITGLPVSAGMTVIILQDAEGNTRLISPREAVAEGVTLYTPDKSGRDW
ncbi:hypothetical protein ACLB1Q_35650 [Escherichia coli]